MNLFASLALFTLALGSPVVDELSTKIRAVPSINGTAEYPAQCKTCPFNLCTNVRVPVWDENVTLTCWTNGDLVGDTRLWLKTTDGCYLSEYDLYEYPGDFSAELEYCGRIPFTITRQSATIRYLTECKWGIFNSEPNIKFYGREEPVTLTCWDEGHEVVKNPFWFKTTDNCYISGAGLWKQPDRSKLDSCGPGPGTRPGSKRQLTEISNENSQRGNALTRRWLQAEDIGEEYAACYTCPDSVRNSTCHVKKVYEFNDTAVSQCIDIRRVIYPNATEHVFRWMLTTDWCYVEGDNFWKQPWNHHLYPECNNWSLSQRGGV